MKSNNQCGCVAVWGPWAYLGRRKALRSNAVQRISTLSPAFTRANFHFVLHTFAAHFNWAIAIQNLCQSLWRNGMSLLAPSRCQFAWWCNFILFHLIFSASQQLWDNEISIRNLYACVVLPFLSHYRSHPIGIFISAYFAFNLVICELRTKGVIPKYWSPRTLHIRRVWRCYPLALLEPLCGAFSRGFRGVFPFFYPPSLAIPLHIHYAGFCGHTHIISGQLYGWAFRAYNQRRHSRNFPFCFRFNHRKLSGGKML